MKCPFQKVEYKRHGETISEFRRCYRTECPAYVPEYDYGRITVPERCLLINRNADTTQMPNIKQPIVSENILEALEEAARKIYGEG